MARKDDRNEINDAKDTALHIRVVHFRAQNTDEDIRDRLTALHEQGYTLHPVCVPMSAHEKSDARELLTDMHGVVIMGASDLYFDGACEHADARKSEALRIRDWLAPLVHTIVERDIPTFAFCFGHQLFADVLGGSVAHCTETGKVGTHRVVKTEAGMQDALLATVPETFSTNYVHKDVVVTAPLSATLLAHGERCHNAMLRYGTNVYTTQFHPELRRAHLAKLLSTHDEYMQTDADRAALETLEETPHAAMLVAAFGERVRSCTA